MTTSKSYTQTLIFKKFVSAVWEAAPDGFSTQETAVLKQELKTLDARFNNDQLNDQMWRILTSCFDTAGNYTQNGFRFGADAGSAGKKMQEILDALAYRDTMSGQKPRAYEHFSDLLQAQGNLDDYDVYVITQGVLNPEFALGSPRTVLDDFTVVDLADMAIDNYTVGVAVFRNKESELVPPLVTGRNDDYLLRLAAQAGGFDQFINKLLVANKLDTLYGNEKNKDLAQDLLSLSRQNDSLFDIEQQRQALAYAMDTIAKFDPTFVENILTEEAGDTRWIPNNKAIRLEACFSALAKINQLDLLRSSLTKQQKQTLNTLLRDQLEEDNNRAGLHSLNDLLQ